jgi:trk system potassium uptake protein
LNLLIVGGGPVVFFLARTFISKGHHVTIINRDAEEGASLARNLKATIVLGDGSDPRILEDASAYLMDALLAVTPNDQDNLVICQLADQRFHIPKTLALVNDPDNEQVFVKIGVTTAFSTTRILASLIEQRTGYEEIVNLLPVGEGSVNITEIALNDNSPVIDKSLKEIDLPENSLIAVLQRNGVSIVPRGSTSLQSGDNLVVITLPTNHGKVLKKLTGSI